MAPMAALTRTQRLQGACTFSIVYGCYWHARSQHGPLHRYGAIRREGVDVVAILEGVEHAASVTTHQQQFLNTGKPSSVASAGDSNGNEPLYKALLAIILKLSATAVASQQQQHDQQQQQQNGQQQEQERSTQQTQQQQQQRQLEAFLQAQPVATSIPFISWIADLEAKSSGAQKAQLAALCEALMVYREQQDRQQQEQLYEDTVKLLAGGDQQATSLLSAEPQQYALALAEGLTGQPVIVQGYSPPYDVLLQVAPAAALTPESVAQGHQLAAELGQELTSRRKSTLAAMLGRTKLTPEQQAQLMGGSPAARICDLLLTLESCADRIALLPDCFTPPEDMAEQEISAAAGAAGSSTEQQQQQQQREGDEETEELWCTPMQLLNEIESRLKLAAGHIDQQQQQQPPPGLPGSSSGARLSSAQQQQRQQQQQLLPGDGSEGLSSAAAVAALEELRDVIKAQWLETLPVGN